ncbi:kinase-like domain-containing protein [Lasiosphaeria miniovina]|uniref:non-specific serine/threonine protein kinase n=1 Tax=Lasiosphaeria miniovina TaxID=1954250 RepID=A0AA40DM46_9PEZI|nr:kinase-like domain-containing protein [Lasiosphaeria miniovina]KAK0705877.1 kinase-like domain-containing protein [Lasiosphaeria miniovina]
MPPKFVLAPLNTAARKATEHFRNKYYQYQLDSHNNTFGLWIDFSDPAKQSFTLGRADTDIFLPELRSAKGASQISDLHASFQVVADTGAVLLFDHSDLGTTEPFSGTTTGHGFTVKFRNNAKSVLVARGINSRIAFGRDKWYQFEIQWRSDGLYDFPSKDEPYTVGPRNSRAKKYVQGEKVGGGAYGNVWWAMDVTDGKLMAVKKFHSLSGKNLEFATREVANLFKINKDTSIQHEHILQIIDSAGGGENDNWGEIFMPLKLGNLKTLVEKTPGIDEQSLGETVLRQMLLALQCISKHNIVHRDIKPENILWEYDADNKYHFCLGDFGLSNDPKIAKTVAGTEPFMAPEVFHRQAQTTKVDIWSLFATVVWVRNAQFRASCSQLGAPQIHAWLVHIAMSPEYASIHTMAQMNPKKRPSATRQLAILDGTVDNYGDPAATGYGADVGADPGVAADESHVGEELGTQFARAMRLHDSSNPGMSYGSGSSDMVTSPEIPYYEPYTSGIMDNYPWGESGEAGPSKDYVPPPAGDSNAPRDQRVRILHDSI